MEHETGGTVESDTTGKSAPTLGSLCMVDRAEKARNFPHNTCAASRHAQVIGEAMARGLFVCDGDSECSRNAGESILAVVAALYEARTALADLRRIPVIDRLTEPNQFVRGFLQEDST